MVRQRPPSARGGSRQRNSSESSESHSLLIKPSASKKRSNRNAAGSTAGWAKYVYFLAFAAAVGVCAWFGYQGKKQSPTEHHH